MIVHFAITIVLRKFLELNTVFVLIILALFQRCQNSFLMVQFFSFMISGNFLWSHGWGINFCLKFCQNKLCHFDMAFEKCKCLFISCRNNVDAKLFLDMTGAL